MGDGQWHDPHPLIRLQYEEVASVLSVLALLSPTVGTRAPEGRFLLVPQHIVNFGASALDQASKRPNVWPLKVPVAPRARPGMLSGVRPARAAFGSSVTSYPGCCLESSSGVRPKSLQSGAGLWGNRGQWSASPSHPFFYLCPLYPASPLGDGGGPTWPFWPGMLSLLTSLGILGILPKSPGSSVRSSG